MTEDAGASIAGGGAIGAQLPEPARGIAVVAHGVACRSPSVRQAPEGIVIEIRRLPVDRPAARQAGAEVRPSDRRPVLICTSDLHRRAAIRASIRRDSRAVGGAGRGRGSARGSRQREARGRCWAKAGSALARRDACAVRGTQTTTRRDAATLPAARAGQRSYSQLCKKRHMSFPSHTTAALSRIAAPSFCSWTEIDTTTLRFNSNRKR